jgi:hypothetical protein
MCRNVALRFCLPKKKKKKDTLFFAGRVRSMTNEWVEEVRRLARTGDKDLRALETVFCRKGAKHHVNADVVIECFSRPDIVAVLTVQLADPEYRTKETLLQGILDKCHASTLQAGTAEYNSFACCIMWNVIAMFILRDSAEERGLRFSLFVWAGHRENSMILHWILDVAEMTLADRDANLWWRCEDSTERLEIVIASGFHDVVSRFLLHDTPLVAMNCNALDGLTRCRRDVPKMLECLSRHPEFKDALNTVTGSYDEKRPNDYSTPLSLTCKAIYGREKRNETTEDLFHLVAQFLHHGADPLIPKIASSVYWASGMHTTNLNELLWQYMPCHAHWELREFRYFPIASAIKERSIANMTYLHAKIPLPDNILILYVDFEDEEREDGARIISHLIQLFPNALHFIDPDDGSPLFAALSAGKLKCVKNFLSLGVRVLPAQFWISDSCWQLLLYCTKELFNRRVHVHLPKVLVKIVREFAGLTGAHSEAFRELFVLA